MSLLTLIKRDNAMTPTEQLKQLEIHLDKLKTEAETLINKQRGNYSLHKTLTDKHKAKTAAVNAEQEKLENNTEYQDLIKSKEELDSKINALNNTNEERSKTKIPDAQEKMQRTQDKIKEKEHELNIRKKQQDHVFNQIETLETNHNNIASRYVLLLLTHECLGNFIKSVKPLVPYWQRIVEKFKIQIQHLEKIKNIGDFDFYTQIYKNDDLRTLVEQLKDPEKTNIRHLGAIPGRISGLSIDDTTEALYNQAPVSICLDIVRSPSPKKSSSPSTFRPQSPVTPRGFTNTLTRSPATFIIPERPSSPTLTLPSGRNIKKISNEERRQRRVSRGDESPSPK